MALKKVRIPNIGIIANVKDERKVNPFVLMQNIFSLTFCFFEGRILLDPTSTEEEQSSGTATFVIDELQDIKYIIKNGRHVLKNVKSLKKLSEQRVKQLTNLLK